MASTTSVLFLFSIIAVSAISVAARPCKTIFFITSSYNDHHLRNPNPHNSPRFTFFVTEIHQFHRTNSFPRPIFFPSSSDDVVPSKPYHSSASSSVDASIRDRTMDIMSIVGALLFGVGCGALTAATMYLIWSLFYPRRFDFSADSDEENADHAVGSDDANKMGYVAIPAATKEVPPSADEVDAMK